MSKSDGSTSAGACLHSAQNNVKYQPTDFDEICYTDTDTDSKNSRMAENWKALNVQNSRPQPYWTLYMLDQKLAVDLPVLMRITH